VAAGITTSDGETFNINVPETTRIRKASRKSGRGLIRNGNNKKSKASRKRHRNLGIAYEKQNNIKEDMANKIVSYLINEYDTIAMQDEMIANWHKGLFGRSVQHSATGKIKVKLKNNSRTVIVERSFPSTQFCPACENLTKLSRQKGL
jgi:transposase